MLKITRLLGITLLLTACVGSILVGDASSQATCSQSPDCPQNVPPPPSQRYDRFGTYHWLIDYAGMGFPVDSMTKAPINGLDNGNQLVKNMGTRTIRVHLGDGSLSPSGWNGAYNVNPPGFIGNCDPGNPSLVQIANTPQYRALFSDSSFQTIMLTTYSPEDNCHAWSVDYNDTKYNREKMMIENLGNFLLSTPAFAGKTFIIFNHEADHPFHAFYNTCVNSGARGRALSTEPSGA